MKLKKYMISIFLLFAVILCHHGSLDFADPGCANSKDLDALAVFISGYEMPPAKADLLRVVPAAEAVAMLEEIGVRENYLLFTRGRALRLLGEFPDEDVWTFLETFVVDPDVKFYLKIEAAHAFARAFGKNSPQGAANVIGTLLKSKDAKLRETAVRILRSMDSADASRILDAHRLIERNKIVKEAL